MKTELKDELRDNTLLAKLVLHCITYCSDQHVKDELIADYKAEGSTLDIKLSLNGHEMDIHSFIERWQDGVENKIDEEVNKRLRNAVESDFIDKFSEMHDMLTELEDSVTKKVQQTVDAYVGKSDV